MERKQGPSLFFGQLSSPLALNGYALAASTALTSVLGVVFWILAARLWSPEELGIGAALISMIGSLAYFAQLNFGNVLNRFLPGSSVLAGSRLITIVYGISFLAALIASGVFLAVVREVAAPLGFLVERLSYAAWFFLGVVATTIFALQDSALAGLRQSIWVPIENVGYAVAKIVLLFVFAGMVADGFGLFVAWTLPLIAAIAAVNALIFFHILPRRAQNGSAPPAFGLLLIARFFGWDYVGTLAMMAALGITPILVVDIAGPAANASFHIAWTIAYSLYLIGRSMSVALLAEGSADNGRLSALAAEAFLLASIPVAAAVVLVVAFAPAIMGFFGPTYAADGTGVLRVLALSTVPWTFVTIALAVARAENRTGVVAVAQAATMALVLGLGMFLLPGMGALGMAFAWLIAQFALALVFFSVRCIREGPDRIVNWLIDVASAAARLRGVFMHRRANGIVIPDSELLSQTLPPEMAGPALATLLPHAVIGSQSDTLSIVYGHASGEASNHSSPAAFVWKQATSPQGIAALERGCDTIEALRSIPGANDCGFELPEIMAVRRTAGTVYVVERAIQGEPGPLFARPPERRQAALLASVEAMSCLHRSTSKLHPIDDDWLEEWIDQSVNIIQQTSAVLISDGRRRAALANFQAEQRSYWKGRAVQLGWGHGDYSLGNILFAAPPQDASTPPVAAMRGAQQDVLVRGIIDWDQARADTPADFDNCYLAITALSFFSDRQIGQVVRDLLRSREREPSARAWLGQHCLHSPNWMADQGALRAMSGLVWIRHVAANLTKAPRYATNRFWIAANIDWVLREFISAGGVNDGHTFH